MKLTKSGKNLIILLLFFIPILLFFLIPVEMDTEKPISYPPSKTVQAGQMINILWDSDCSAETVVIHLLDNGGTELYSQISNVDNDGSYLLRIPLFADTNTIWLVFILSDCRNAYSELFYVSNAGLIIIGVVLGLCAILGVYKIRRDNFAKIEENKIQKIAEKNSNGMENNKDS